MKSAIVFCVLSVAVMAYARPEESTYTDRFDNVNLDEILSNRRILESHMKCILGEDKCTAEGKELKKHIPEALSTGCEKCTEAQKTGTRKVIKHLVNKEPAFWKQLSDKFDPEGKFTSKYENELKEIKA